MASPTYNGNGGISYSSSDTVTPAYPTLQADDILILQVITDTNNTHNQPTNWNKVTQLNQGTGASGSWHWKRAVGDETGNLTVTQSASGDIWAVISVCVVVLLLAILMNSHKKQVDLVIILFLHLQSLLCSTKTELCV